MGKVNLIHAQLLIDEEEQEHIDKQHEAELEEQRIQEMHDQWDMEWAERHKDTRFKDDDFDWEDQTPCSDPEYLYHPLDYLYD